MLGQFRVMAALHQDLRTAQRDCLLNLSIQIIIRDDIRVRIPFCPIKRAKFAINVANVGVVDVPIDDVSDDLIATAIIRGALGQMPASIRQRAQFFEWQEIKLLRLSLINPPAVPNLL